MSEKKKTLEELLDDVSVLFPGDWENESTPTLGDWYAVVNDDGIIAYFGKKEHAFFFRLAYINALLNDITKKEE